MLGTLQAIKAGVYIVILNPLPGKRGKREGNMRRGKGKGGRGKGKGTRVKGKGEE